MSLDLQIKPAGLDSGYNPDVLTCLANLSNDEVFTPPSLANEMLDQLPEELWSDPNAKFLDPVSKSGVFLREIAKRLTIGLESQIPDTQERINHIYTKQIFGIGITELTALLTRRSLYCSKYANGKYSIVTNFENEDGNVDFTRIEHKWFNDKCVFCGANQSEYDRSDDLETHAYKFIHTNKPEEIYNMQFDVIIGNPPYQLSTGGSKSQATPLYNKFITQAKKLNPRYLSMVIPDRWFSGGFGLNEFRSEMLGDNRIRKMAIFPVASEVFPGVDIPGGICYFLWDRDNPGLCKVDVMSDGKKSTAVRPLLEPGVDVFIRYNEAVSIINKVKSHGEKSIIEIISSQKPFGLATTYSGSKDRHENYIGVYGRNQNLTFAPRAAITSNASLIDSWKVYISAAYGERIASNYLVTGKPFIGAPGTVCTETYITFAPLDSQKEADDLRRYIHTKFFRFLVLMHKPTQHVLRKVYDFVPMQDFSEEWSDEKLYKKYGITEDEIAFIESMIRPMELSN